jgi:hypothetical protein
VEGGGGWEACGPGNKHRRKKQREERDVAVITVLADGKKGLEPKKGSDSNGADLN